MELFRALAVLVEPPLKEAEGVARALRLGALPSASEYTETFIFQLYPYASIYLGAEGMMGGEARDRVAGFWRALGETPPAEPDHLAVMLALYAQVVELEDAEPDEARRESWGSARKAFLWEHLLSWLPFYLMKLADVAPPFYRRWGEMLLSALLEEALKVGRQETLSLHLRDAPALANPQTEETEEFLQSILCPARSGMILLRSDFVGAARKLGLGARMGERQFILKGLLGQDAAGVLNWLAEEATLWSQRYEREQKTLGQVAVFWKERAEASASLLRELKLSAAEV
jgi:TorA maturation chaperone TorD